MMQPPFTLLPSTSSSGMCSWPRLRTARGSTPHTARVLACACDCPNRSLCCCEPTGQSTGCEVWACLDSSDAQQEQWKQQGGPHAERGALGGKPIPRTQSVEESGRSSATLGTASAEEWLQQAAREGGNDGDSPASRLQYQLMQGVLRCTHSAEAAVQNL